MKNSDAPLAHLRGPLSNVPDPLRLPPPPAKPFDVLITPPGSKSLTNRALLLAALAEGESTLHGPLTEADDAERMIAALTKLGATITPEQSGSALRVRGVGGRWKPQGGQSDLTLNLNNAGTATRFLAAAALLYKDKDGLVIDGNARMRQRPIGDLTELLTALGATCEWPPVNGATRAPGCPPVRITPPKDLASLRSTIDVGTTSSSQFISALLLTAAFLPNGLTLRFTGTPTSVSYIEMTVALMRKLGVRVEGMPVSSGTGSGGAPVHVHPLPHAKLPAFVYRVEPDASGATYFWAAAALTPGARVRIDGLAPRDSLQGDAAFAHLLEQMGASVQITPAPSPSTTVTGGGTLRPIDADLSLMPDAAMTLAVLCCFATPTPNNPTAVSTLRGLRTLRVKETDRLAALQTELSKLGARIEIVAEGNDESLVIAPPSPSPSFATPSGHDTPVAFNTYDDHRMAMALALVALRRSNVIINDPACVRKTYPAFWNDWATLYT